MKYLSTVPPTRLRPGPMSVQAGADAGQEVDAEWQRKRQRSSRQRIAQPSPTSGQASPQHQIG